MKIFSKTLQNPLNVAIIVLIVVAVVGIPTTLYFGLGKSNYELGVMYFEDNQYTEAIDKFEGNFFYGDSAEKIAQVKDAITKKKNSADYDTALKLFEAKKYRDAANAFKALGDYKDAVDLAKKAGETQEAIDKVAKDASAAEAKSIAEEKARVAAAEAEARSTKYYVTSYDDYAICIRSSPTAPNNTCKPENVNRAGYNIVAYINKGDRSVRMKDLKNNTISEGYTWYNVEMPNGQTGWVREDVVKEG